MEIDTFQFRIQIPNTSRKALQQGNVGLDCAVKGTKGAARQCTISLGSSIITAVFFAIARIFWFGKSVLIYLLVAASRNPSGMNPILKEKINVDKSPSKQQARLQTTATTMEGYLLVCIVWRARNRKIPRDDCLALQGDGMQHMEQQLALKSHRPVAG